MEMKLLTIALAVVVLVASTTSAYRTTITTVEIDDTQPSSRQCQQQIQSQSLNHCQQYVRQQSRGSYLAMRTDEYLNQQQQQHFEPCCQELRQISEECQCEALEQILQQQQQQGELRGQKLQKVARQLQNLPRRCQSASRSCQIRGSGSWF